ncbi:MAG: hypothetical protein IJ880_11455 [Bacilli bacterium]|nr:hypothetical protein [Bacilli bacterium]
MQIEDKIKSYIKNYFTNEEKDILRNYYFDNYENDDVSLDDSEYQNLSKLCKTLIQSPLSDKYRIEVGPSCRYLINRLVNTYVDDTTLVLTTEQEHSSVKNALKEVKNLMVLNVDSLYLYETYDKVIKEFKNKKCDKVFLLMAGTLPGTFEVINQKFFTNLKATLLQNNIPSLFILDDCQGCGFIVRSYDLFDGILATGHVFIPGFDMGILFTKLNKKIGYFNKTGLKHLVEKISIILKHRDKALAFNDLLSEYFDYELNKLGFEKFNNQALHKFAFKITNNTFTQKQYDDLIKYKVRISDSHTPITNISIRCHEIMIQDPDKVIKGLELTKKLLKKIYRAKELGIDKNIIYSNEKIINENDQSFQYLDDFYKFTPDVAEKVKQVLLQQTIINSRVR